MQIKSTTVQTPQAPKQERPVYKPLTEKWTVDTDSFTSTKDLVSKGDALNNKSATYTYTTSADGAPFTRKEQLANAVGTAFQGATAGAIGGAVVGALISFVAGVGDILGGFMGGRMDGVSRSLLTVPIALGTLGGAAFGAAGGWQMEAKAGESTVRGTLQTENGQVNFYPNGQVQNKVNLTEFQSAPEAPTVQGTAAESKPLVNTLKGAAIGAATVPALMIPLAGMAAGGYVGATAGAALDQRTALGSGLGLAVGVASTAGTIYAINTAGFAGAAGVAAGLAVVGGAIGNAVFQGMESTPTQYASGEQWWTKHAIKPEGPEM